MSRDLPQLRGGPSSAQPQADDVSAPDEAEVRAELSKIQQSDPFVRSQRIRRLLEFLVDSVLAGNGQQLKESLIGVEVFDRPPDYDPKQDPVVRVEMRRLRSKLSEYYLHEGKLDGVLIWLDKGTYVPNLVWQGLKTAGHSNVSGDEGNPSPAAIAAPSEQPANVPAASSRPRGRRPLVWTGGIASLLVAGAVGILFVRSPKPASPLRVFPLTGNGGLETSPSFSPDGKQIAYAWDGNRRNFDIFVKPIDGGVPRRLTDSAAHEIDPAWSPDGHQLAFLRVFPQKTELIVIPSTGGVEKVIADLGPEAMRWHPEEPEQNGAGGPSWSPDGSSLVVSAPSGSGAPRGLVEIRMDGQRIPLTSPPAGISDFTPRISPSGKFVAFTRNWGAGSFDLFLVPLRGGNPVRLTFDSREIQGESWLDRDTLLYSSNRLGNFRLWQERRWASSPLSVAVGGAQPQWPAVSPDGHWLAFVEPVSAASIWRLNLSAGQDFAPESFLSSAARDYSPNFSPDRKKVAFVSDRSGSAQIWIADSDGLDVKQLTNFRGSSLGSPHWSPNSRRLVFDGGLNKEVAIWLVDADGGNLHRMNNSGDEQYMPSWSHDGQWVYFSSKKSGHLWKQKPATGEAFELTNDGFIDATESSDGQTIYIQKIHGGIWRLPASGGTPAPIPELAGVLPGRYWTVRGDVLYFVRQETSPYQITAFDLATKRFRKLGTISAPLMVGTQGVAVNPSGDELLFVQKDQRRSSIMLQER